MRSDRPKASVRIATKRRGEVYRIDSRGTSGVHSNVVVDQGASDTRPRPGLRDRAILDVFYSTGIRPKELIGLRTDDIHMECGLVLVRESKGRKDRNVSIGQLALT